MDLTSGLRRFVRAAVGMSPDDGMAVDRLALYRAQVKACASDGSTVDVAPEDTRLDAMQGIPVRVGIPGAVAIIAAGAIVLVGWEKGDSALPYAVPSWEAGATVTKLILNGSTVIAGAEAGAQFVALANLVKAQLDSIQAALLAHTHAGVTVGAGSTGPSNSTYAAGAVAAAQVKAK